MFCSQLLNRFNLKYLKLELNFRPISRHKLEVGLNCVS